MKDIIKAQLITQLENYKELLSNYMEYIEDMGQYFEFLAEKNDVSNMIEIIKEGGE